MPYYGISIAEAVARKQAVKWFTGLLSRPYLPWSFDQNPSLPNGSSQPSKHLARSPRKAVLWHIKIISLSASLS